MDIRKMTKEELEQLSYADSTYYLLKETNKPRTTGELFLEIVELLGLPESVYSDKIGDYYTFLTTDKRFIILKNGKWDLRINQSSDNFMIVIDDEEEEEEVDGEEEVINDEEEEFDSLVDEEEELIDDDNDVLEDLSIIDEDFER